MPNKRSLLTDLLYAIVLGTIAAIVLSFVREALEIKQQVIILVGFVLSYIVGLCHKKENDETRTEQKRNSWFD